MIWLSEVIAVVTACVILRYAYGRALFVFDLYMARREARRYRE